MKECECLCFLSGAPGQRDLPLSQPARPSDVELRPAGDGAPLQSGDLQSEQVSAERPNFCRRLPVH